MTPPTYTRPEAMKLLGLKQTNSNSAFHYLRRRYPDAFVVVHQGKGKGDITLYDKETLDKFIQWRNSRKVYEP
jgi:hypothetical protein